MGFEPQRRGASSFKQHWFGVIYYISLYYIHENVSLFVQDPEHIIQDCPTHAFARVRLWPSGASFLNKLWGTKQQLETSLWGTYSFRYDITNTTFERRVREWLVFYVAFNNLSVISRRWLLVAWDAIYSRVLSAANTDAPCRRHKTRLHHPVTLSWHRANQSWFYPLNAERLARKQPVPIFTPLVWCGRGSNPRPPDYETNAYPLGHRAGFERRRRSIFTL